MQGLEAAAHALYGVPELTVWEPGVVNTRHPVLKWERFHPAALTWPESSDASL
jgi:hypothetical protein